MKTLLAAGLVLFATSFASGQTSTWVKFESAPGKFSISLPAQPTEDKKTVESPHGPYTSTLFTANGTGEFYIVGWVDYDPKFVFNPEAELDANRDNLIKGVNGKLLSSHKITRGGYQGLEFTGEFAVESRSFGLKSQVFIVGKRPYMMTYVFLQGKESLENGGKFFPSFKVRPNG